MNIKQIRNATIIITYSGKKILIDPFLCDKGSHPPIPGTFNQNKPNPLVGLPISIDEIIDVDFVILTHLHHDHFDEVAKSVLPKNIKIFSQNEEEAAQLRVMGFKNIEVLNENGTFLGDIKLTKTKGLHGTGEVVESHYKEDKVSKEACGVVFNHQNEKKLYLTGDTIWCDEVHETLNIHKPDIIVVAAGDGRFLEGDAMIMGAAGVYEVYKASPNSKIIANHFEAVNPCILSRKDLKHFLDIKGITSNVLIPDDGESYTF